MKNYFSPRPHVCAALCLLSCGSFAHAAEIPALEKVLVSATRSETVQLPLATTITVINEEQIRLSGATQVAEVLRLQAGIQLQDFDGSGGRNVTLGMRGFTDNAANNVLVLVDGRRLNNASLAGPALNTVALKDIERIEIVHGSAGVLYGDQAVGGVINIITRGADQKFNGSLQVLGGSDALRSYSLNINQGFASGVSYNLSAQQRKADNYRDNNESDYENIFAQLRYDFTNGHVFAEGQYIDDRLNFPGSLSDEQAAIDPRQTFTPADFGNQKTDIWRVGGAFTLHANWELLAEFAERQEDSTSVYSDNLTAQTLTVKHFTPRLIGTFAMAGGNAVVTLGYDHNEADYMSASDWGASDTAQENNGTYGQIVLPLTQSLVATLGARYAEAKATDNFTGDQHRHSLNAQEAGLSYQVTPALRTFVRYAEGFRFANADENAFTPMGIDYLAPQTSESLEAGIDWSAQHVALTLTAYDMDIDNELMFDSPSFVNINLPKSQRRGVIADALVTINEKISVRTNYTYTDAELLAGSFAGNQVPFVAQNTANIGLLIKPQENLTAAVDASYTGSRYRVGDDANGADKIGDITLLSANLLWALTDHLELGLRIKNITNKRYADYYAVGWNGNVQYPQAGRTYQASINYQF